MSCNQYQSSQLRPSPPHPFAGVRFVPLGPGTGEPYTSLGSSRLSFYSCTPCPNPWPWSLRSGRRRQRNPLRLNNGYRPLRSLIPRDAAGGATPTLTPWIAHSFPAQPACWGALRHSPRPGPAPFPLSARGLAVGPATQGRGAAGWELGGDGAGPSPWQPRYRPRRVPG